MLILGLETSCDETAAAVVAEGTRVLSNVVSSQHELHEQYRGVVPEIASRAHLQRLLPVVDQAVRRAGVAWADLDAVAVGNRPGLIGSLIVGVAAAKALAWSLSRPLIGIDHVQAHLHAAFLEDRAQGSGLRVQGEERRGQGSGLGVQGEEPQADRTTGNSTLSPEPRTLNPLFPALGLVVSGGHTSLYLIPSPGQLQRVGRTIDDAVGEAYDKAAVILGLPYPGGPHLDRLAAAGDPSRFDLPRSPLGPDSLDFSFSGLKTALLYAVRGHPTGRGPHAAFPRSERDLTDADRRDLAAAFQHAAMDAVATKLRRAVDRFRPHQVILGGGVSANSLLRARCRQLQHDTGIPVLTPALPFCLDNAAMIAGQAHHRLAAGDTDPLDLPALATGATA